LFGFDIFNYFLDVFPLDLI